MLTSSCFEFEFNTKTKRVYRYGKAFVYIKGIPYYFAFRPQQSTDRPNLKLKDVMLPVDEVKRLPWKGVSSKARIAVGIPLKNKSITCLRLRFDHPGDKVVFLSRTSRCRIKNLNRGPAMESMSKETKIATDEDKCAICITSVPDAKFAPCGNTGVCCDCAFKLIQTTRLCPLCRKGVTFFTRASMELALQSS
jgi:hypothetical protein